ncbi:hypothetical protein HanHA300_Chr14g0532321 [Helianthus annuus]|nr:hypothetical protein HanHA300_Chr14g0532321 [Helianthus annuus]KAJ0486479.1 hypothetical protein HanHA89_Chr14g0580121 [Helianthus annuus]KAJ0657045.1 hypothetical protein HanLR1_Chr14g0542701 [Helianthus annuus]KAJ0660628.1 hypothetical protein HanOQP8_Chr14g0539881 [Helianthus annuus]
MTSLKSFTKRSRSILPFVNHPTSTRELAASTSRLCGGLGFFQPKHEALTR